MIYAFADFDLDEAAQELYRSGIRVPLQPKPLALLLLLIQENTRALDTDELRRRLWPGVHVTAGSVRRAVNAARVALGDSGDRQRFISTAPGGGYRFRADIRRLDDPIVSRTERDPFVGRSAELEGLVSTWRDARQGQGRLALILGEPGIGKSRLLRELSLRAREDDVRIASGWSPADLESPPGALFSSVLRSLARDAGEHADAVADLSERVALAPLTPDLALAASPEREPEDGTNWRTRCFAALAGRLERASRRGGLLLCLEDLHWADPFSLAALDWIARELRGLPVLVVATLREREARDRAEVLDALARLPVDLRIEVGGLDEAASNALFRAAVDYAADARTLRSVWTRSQGNPLFICELARSLRPGLLRGEGTTDAHQLLPVGVLALLRQRFAPLSPGCLNALRLAALLGESIAARWLAATLDRPLSELAPLLDEAVRAGIIERTEREPVERFRFAHALHRDALLHGLDARALAEASRQIVEGLERLPDDVEEVQDMLAVHALAWARRGGDPFRALAHARRAAALASRRLAHDKATLHYEQGLAALELAPEEDSEGLRCELLVALGTSLKRCGEMDRALDTAERAAAIARASGDARGLARAALVPYVRGAESNDAFERQNRLLEEADSALAGEESPLRASLLAHHARCLYYASGSGPRRVKLCEEAIALARRLGDRSALCDTLHARATATWHALDPPARLALCGELVELTSADVKWPDRLHASQVYLTALLEHGRLEAFDAELASVVTAVAEHATPRAYTWFAPLYRGTRALMRGDLEAAEGLIEQAQRLGRHASSYDASRAAQTQLLQLRIDQGRIDELEPALRALAGRYETDASYPTLLAYVHAERGERDAAQAQLERALAHYDPRWDTNRAITGTVMANVCATIGFAEPAPRIVRWLTPLADYNAVNLSGWICQGSVEWPLGLLAQLEERLDDAIAHLERAVARNQAQHLRPYEARARTDLGAALLARGGSGDTEAARKVLDRAVALVRAVGMPGLESLARDRLHRAAGVAVMRSGDTEVTQR